MVKIGKQMVKIGKQSVARTGIRPQQQAEDRTGAGTTIKQNRLGRLICLLVKRVFSLLWE